MKLRQLPNNLNSKAYTYIAMKLIAILMPFN